MTEEQEDYAVAAAQEWFAENRELCYEAFGRMLDDTATPEEEKAVSLLATIIRKHTENELRKIGPACGGPGAGLHRRIQQWGYND